MRSASRSASAASRDLGLDDAELVAADPRRSVSVSRDAGAQPRRHRAQQFVADRMAERVVDRLELVEIEAQHREPLPALDVVERLLEPLAQAARGSAGR